MRSSTTLQMNAINTPALYNFPVGKCFWNWQLKTKQSICCLGYIIFQALRGFMYILNPIRPRVLGPVYAFRNINWLHLKKNGLILKKSVRFRDLKILWIWDFATTWLTKIAVTPSIFRIEGSYFGLFLIFMCFRNHI